MKSAALIFLFAVQFGFAGGRELFNGTNFDGWTFCMKENADPLKTWSVTNGVIHCTGTPTGYMRTKEIFSSYVVTVVWRFVEIAPKKDNTGVLVHVQLPDKVWPMCVQNQGKSGRQGDLFVMAGAECKEHLALGKDANTPVPLRGAANENPIGEWNTNVTICAGNKVRAIINGKELNEITECTLSSGFIGIQSEGGDIEIRKIQLQPIETTGRTIEAEPAQDIGKSDIPDAKLRAAERAKRDLP